MSIDTGMSVQSWFNDVWYGRATPPWWLLPLSALYGAASGVRREAYAKHLRPTIKLSCPVVVVGNLSVGGTGKTPLVCWLVTRLVELGLKPGVVTRGYGGSSRHSRLVVMSNEADLVGDEAILLARRTQVPIAIGRDRPAASQLLIGAGCDVIVSDDGLQHYALARDCEILVIDAQRRLGNGRLLPAGPLRESAARLDSVDAVVLNVESASIEESPASKPSFAMRFEPGAALPVAGGTAKALSDFSGKSVHAVAAIGNPQRFFTMLRSYGIEVLAHPLPDHALLSASDIVFGDGLPVLMTEKDAVKCGKIAGAEHWYVPISATFENRESQALLDIVIKAIQKRASTRTGNHG